MNTGDTSQCDCKHEAKIAMLDHRDSTIVDALHELKGKVDLILIQTTKIAVHEVYHNNHSEALHRAFGRIEDTEHNVNDLAKETREFMNQVRGMMKMAYWLWGAMGTGLGLMALKVLFGE